MSIPKIIHYCWFGPNPIPELELRCIESWKKYLPDYEIMFWNENTFDINNSCDYAKDAYEAKYYAFVADYVRIYALVKYGGIYMDTDMELLAPIDIFLKNEAFTGFENKTRVAAGIIGCVKNNIIFKRMLEYYNSTKFIDSNNLVNINTICSVMMNVLEKEGFVYKNSEQHLKNIHIYERDIFYPKKMKDGHFRVSDRSVSIHHYVGSWLTPRQKKRGENIFWCNVCRPILRKCKSTLVYLSGKKTTRSLEMRVRNWLK